MTFVGCLIRVSILRGPGEKGTSFRLRIILGTIFICFLVFSISIPGCLRNGSAEHRTSGFRENSSNLDRAPKIRLSVTLKSWDKFFLTLPSISTDTWVIYSFWIPGTIVFRDRLHIDLSSWFSLSMAANFLLLFGVAFLNRKKYQSAFRTELKFYDYFQMENKYGQSRWR